MRTLLLAAIVLGASALTTPAAPPQNNRVAEIAAMLPERAVGVGRPISDRTHWDALAVTPAYKAIIENAVKIAAGPIPDQPESLYLDYSKTGNRDNWQNVAFERRGRLTFLLLAECAENKGRFFAKIAEYVDALCAERSWVWPAHDKELETFYGKSMYVDLGAAELGWQMATARWLLGDKLPEAQQNRIKTEVTRRIVEPYLAAVRGNGKGLYWMSSTNNWNAVCHAGVVGAILATADDRTERATAVAAAELHIQHFLDGFTSDGYCSEGLVYWNYGFGHYAQMTETIRQATGGKLDLFARPGVVMPALFGRRIQIMNGVAPALADCAVYPRPSAQIMWYVNHRLGLGWKDYESLTVQSLRDYLPEEVLYRSVEKTPLPVVSGAPAQVDSPLRTWFDKAGVLIARPGPAQPQCKMGVTLKGGHNAEHHNHNDLGTFVVVMGDRYLVADPGPEEYTARTFSAKRYDSNLLNSFGHPVPVVAGQLQRPGGDARAKILKAEFTDERDTLSLDLTSAYAVPELKRLTRTFVYSRAAAGSLEVVDEVEFASPQTFGIALISLGKVQTAEAHVDLEDAGHVLRATIDAGPARFTFKTEPILEDSHVKPIRVGINLEGKVDRATVRMVLTPH